MPPLRVPAVAVQRAAHRAGNADQRFQPGQAAIDRGGDDLPQQCPAARDDRTVLEADFAKAGALRWTIIPFTPSSRTMMFEPRPKTALAGPPRGSASRARQLVGRFRFGEILRWPAQLEPGMHGHHSPRRTIVSNPLSMGIVRSLS